MAKPWTAEELAILNQRYPKKGASDALVKTLNRTKQAIHFKAQQVGLRNANRKRFTDEAVSYTHLELASINEAAAIVGNSEDITYKLRNLFNAEM